MSKTLSDQVIALAGLLQAADLTQTLARKGSVESSALETSLSSLLKINADSVAEVYGGVQNLSSAFRLMVGQLENPAAVDPELARYVAGLYMLSGKLLSNMAVSKKLRAGIEQAAALSARYGMTHEKVIGKFAELYQDNISGLGPKILIHGDPSYINTHAPRIRAILLAGIRSAVLWRQCGGNEWRLLFFRRKIRDEALRLARL